MTEKFLGNKRKEIFLSLTALVGAVTIIIIGSSLLNSDKNAEKEKQKIELPKVKYIDSDKVEEKSFKETYGKELILLKQKQDQVDKKLAELDKKEQEDKKKLNKNEDNKSTKIDNTDNSLPPQNLLNNMDIKIPPLSDIENEAFNLNKNKMNAQEPSKMETFVEENLLVIEGIETTPVEEKTMEEMEKKDKKPKKEEKFVLPAGTFVKSILLSGLDAPTFANAKSEPHPVVLRITDDANLPNNFKTDIKECRAIASGYGELSSDRAIIRVESITCMKKDGSIYSSSGNSIGFVTGEDGKIGLAGRVVSKQGAILARTMVAGFVEGMGEVFKNSSQTITTTVVGTTSTIDPNKATQMGVYGGVGEGAKKLSEYYLKLNDQMFPVVEINVGRKCDVILNSSVTLKKVEDK